MLNSSRDDRQPRKSYGSRFEQGQAWTDDLLDDLREEIHKEMRVHRPKYTKAVLAALTPEQDFVRCLLLEVYTLLIQIGLGRGGFISKEELEADPAFYAALETVTSEEKREQPARMRANPRPKPQPECTYEECVYFIQAEGTNFVKIGVSVGGGKRRLNGLQTGSPFTLRLIAEMKGGTIEDERILHERFGHLRERGEWFRLESELQLFIDGLASEGK